MLPVKGCIRFWFVSGLHRVLCPVLFEVVPNADGIGQPMGTLSQMPVTPSGVADSR